MKNIPVLLCFLCLFTGKAFAALDLVIPDATDRTASLLAKGQKANVSPPAPPPGSPGTLNLPSPPVSVLPPPSAAGLQGLAPDSADVLQELATQLESWQVSAVLGDSVVLRAPSVALGPQVLTLTHGQAQPWVSDVVLRPQVQNGTLVLTASLNKRTRVVFVGQLQQAAAPSAPTKVPGTP